MKMQTKNDLHKQIIALEGKRAGSYRDLDGQYNFSEFVMTFEYVQSEQKKASARIRIRVPFSVAKFPHDVFSTPSRTMGACDYLTRLMSDALQSIPKKNSQLKDVRAVITKPGDQIIPSSAIIIDKDVIEARLTTTLPTQRGTLPASEALQLLTEAIPDCVRSSLMYAEMEGTGLVKWIEACEDADAARAQLKSKGLVSFIAEGSIIAEPLQKRVGVVNKGIHVSDENVVTLDLPNRGEVRGLGIPQGITVITGGRRQGKSVCVRALELGIYNHAPGTGRELVVTARDAVGIAEQPGRAVTEVDVMPILGESAGRRERLATLNAGGEASLAASVMETLEIGTSCMIFDEDRTPVTLLGRDARMQALVPDTDGRMLTLCDILPVMKEELNVSSIIAVSGFGDYLDIADTVIAMNDGVPEVVTDKAKKIAAEMGEPRKREHTPTLKRQRPRRPLQHSLAPQKEETHSSYKPQGRDIIVQYGDDFIDITGLTQIVSQAQGRTLSRSLALIHRLASSGMTVPDVVNRVMTRIDQVGLDTLSPRIMGDLALIREQDLAAVLNRWRRLKIT